MAIKDLQKENLEMIEEINLSKERAISLNMLESE
jgi:hypothetical protein